MMDKKDTDEKLRKNAMHVTGVSALKKIRTLVDDFESQEQKNKKRLLALFTITILIISFFIYIIISNEHKPERIKLDQLNSLSLQQQYIAPCSHNTQPTKTS